MRYLIVLFIVMAFVAGCGCSNVLTPPALAANAKDIWPALYGVAANGADEGHFIVYDQLAGAWQAPRLIANDLLALQWTPQRNSVGWFGGTVVTTGGTYNVSFIEDASNDLEIWNSPDDGWQDDAGAWGLLDDDASQDWVAVDVETRQNYVWSYVAIGVPLAQYWYVDLAAGVPAWTAASTAQLIDGSGGQFSIVLDQRLLGGLHYVWQTAGGAIDYAYGGWNGGSAVVDAAGTYPQVIVTSVDDIWCFYTDGNVLYSEVAQDKDTPVFALEIAALYIATALDDDYHVTWLAYDDTIHVALVDRDQLLANQTHLIYMRRTPNGWVEQEILLTVDGSGGGDQDDLYWPQITVDTFGNIFVYYIYFDFDGVQGDLQGFYLDVDDYDDPVAANWTQHVNIDQSADLVKWVVAPDSVPISMEM